MKYLLTKEQLLSINEAAVSWDRSALGLLTKAVISPLTWLAGSIKKGLNKRRMSALTMQWGIEYVKALRALDLKLDVQQDAELGDADVAEETAPEETTTETPTDSTEFKITEKNKPELLKVLTDEAKYFSSLRAIVNGMSSWITINNPTGFATAKKSLTAIQDIDISDNLQNILKLIPNNKVTEIGTTIQPVNDFCNDIKNMDLSAFNKKFKITDVNALKKVVAEMLAYFTTIGDTYKTAIKFVTDFKGATAAPVAQPAKLVVGNQYEYTNKKGVKTFVKLLSIDHKVEKGADGLYFTDDDIDKDTLDKDVAQVIGLGKDNKFSNTAQPYTVLKKNLKETKQTESVQYGLTTLITEAAAYKIPENVEDLLSNDELLKFETMPDIKKNSFAKINFVRLDAIKYEANYLFETSKKKPTADNKEDSNLELKKVWDIGIKNINDHFQKVIDIEAVIKKIPITIETPGKADANVVAAVKETDSKIVNLQNLGLTETVPEGYKFDKNKLYAFDCSFIGQNNKALSTTLLMSPTSEYKETIDDKTYFWFKLLGGYKYDDKTKTIVRKNIFNGYTPNTKIVDNFKRDEDAYYLVTRNLRGKPTQQYVYIYSNTGKFFFNNNIVDDVTTVAEEIKTYKKDKFDATIKEIANVSNLFRIKINQRFLVDDTYITGNKYPGIQNMDLTTDKGFDTAQKNHNKFIDLIK